MATIVERREARRRRILENSEERLNRILNIQNKNREEESHNNEIKHEVLKTNKYVNTETTRVRGGSTNDFFEAETSNTDLNLSGSALDLNAIFENRLPEENSQLELEFEGLYYKQLSLNDGFVIFLAFIVRYLCFISKQYAYLMNVDIFEKYLNKIFVPILLYEVIETLYFRPHRKNVSFFTTILLFGGRRNKILQSIASFFYHFHCIFQHIVLYFFSFVVFDLFINFLTNETESVT